MRYELNVVLVIMWNAFVPSDPFFNLHLCFQGPDTKTSTAEVAHWTGFSLLVAQDGEFQLLSESDILLDMAYSNEIIK